MNPNTTLRPTARTLALQVLLECQESTAFGPEILDKHLNWSNLSAPDRRLATQLVYGVLRRRGTLDALLKVAVTRRRDQVEPWLWEALHLGVYQLALLSHIPPHAAIYETVELAEFVGLPRGKGFLNGVLRKVASLLTEEIGDQPAADAVPLEHGRYRRLTQAVFHDPKIHHVGYLAKGFSWPTWLAERWYKRFGWDECVRLGFWFAGPGPLYLRCNPLQTDRQTVLTALAEAGIKAEPGTHEQSIHLLEHAAIPALPGYWQGWFTVQDESAMSVASALNPSPGMRVLDLCAAPGGKTTHLAELMRNQGEILACDVDKERLVSVTEQCARLGITIVAPRLIAPSGPPLGPFDAALVDVPCSNTGVLGKRPEARWRLQPGDIPHLIRLQSMLLLQAYERVRPGGVIVYSTCSIEPEENQGVVEAVRKSLPDLILEEEVQSTPGQPADGGYRARLKRRV
jgi:16S rRNA (cytosine967-C5)-methyltransferase